MRNKIHTVCPNGSPLQCGVKESAQAQVQPSKGKGMWKIPWQPLPAVPPPRSHLGVLQGSTSAHSEGPLPHPLCVWAGRRCCQQRQEGWSHPAEGAFPRQFCLSFSLQGCWVAPSTIPRLCPLKPCPCAQRVR